MPLFDAYDVLTALEAVEDDFLSKVSSTQAITNARTTLTESSQMSTLRLLIVDSIGALLSPLLGAKQSQGAQLALCMTSICQSK